MSKNGQPQASIQASIRELWTVSSDPVKPRKCALVVKRNLDHVWATLQRERATRLFPKANGAFV